MIKFRYKRKEPAEAAKSTSKAPLKAPSASTLPKSDAKKVVADIRKNASLDNRTATLPKQDTGNGLKKTNSSSSLQKIASAASLQKLGSNTSLQKIGSTSSLQRSRANTPVQRLEQKTATRVAIQKTNPDFDMKNETFANEDSKIDGSCRNNTLPRTKNDQKPPIGNKIMKAEENAETASLIRVFEVSISHVD